MATVEVAGLVSDRGESVVLEDVSLSVAAGEILGLLGPEGAGKTTLLRTLVGLSRPTDGSVTVLGADARDPEALRRARADVGYVPADPAPDPTVTGRYFLEYRVATAGGERREALVDRFDLPLDRSIGSYEPHEVRRLCLLAAAVTDPDLLLLDEPLAGLDPLHQEETIEFLRREAERGVAVVLATSELSVPRRLADRVGVLRDGRLLAVESSATFLEHGAKHVRLQTGEELRAMDLNLLGVVDLVMTEAGAQFTFLGDYALLVDHLADFDVVDVAIEEPPLADVLDHYYGSVAAPTAGEGPGRGGTDLGDAAPGAVENSGDADPAGPDGPADRWGTDESPTDRPTADESPAGVTFVEGEDRDGRTDDEERPGDGASGSAASPPGRPPTGDAGRGDADR